MKNLYLYLGIDDNEFPYPVLFKKIGEEKYSKKDILDIGIRISKDIEKVTYVAGFDEKGKMVVAHDFQDGEHCGELDIDHLKYIVLGK